MGYVKDAVLKSANAQGIACESVAPQFQSDLWKKLAVQLGFAWGCPTNVDGVDEFGFRCSRPDLVCNKVLPESPLHLFVDDENELCCLKFLSSNDLSAILGDLFAFQFAITSDDGAYVLAGDDHELLTGLGDAASWLREFSKDD